MYKLIKRLTDILVSFIAILILTPILIPIMIGLKLTGEGYIFYLQERVGLHNKYFNIYKFATMLKDSPNMKGGLMTTTNDSRFTPMGAFLRKSKINELPQLFNILLGDMSIVGPRPVMQKSFDAYPDEVKKIIYNIKPGLTGIGSLIYRDEEQLITDVKAKGLDAWDFYKNKIYPHKGKLEIWYQQNISLWTDLKIIFATAYVIVFTESDIAYTWFKGIPKRNFK